MLRTGLAALGATLALAGVLPAAAGAGEIVISTGGDRGSYRFIGERLKTELVLAGSSRAEVRTSEGSVANLEQLADPASPVNVALTQSDVLDVYLTENPAFQGHYLVLGDAGRECVLLIGPAGSEIASLSDLQRRGGQVSVGGSRSGARVTFTSMMRIAPALASLRPVPVPTLEALLQLKEAPTHGKLRAAMVVQRPRRVSPPIDLVLKKPDAYRLLPIREADVGNDTLPDGSAVYSYEKVAVGGVRGGGLQIDTLCTRGLLLGSRDKLSDAQRSLLSELMLDAGDRIIGKDE
jgi:hypothetical protein